MFFAVGTSMREVEIFVFMRGQATIGEHLTADQADLLVSTGRYHIKDGVVYYTELSPL